MEDLWIVLYDSDTGDVWSEVVRGTRIEAIVFASWLVEAAGGPPRYHSAVLPAWMPIPTLAEVLGPRARNVFTRWTAPQNGLEASEAPTTTQGSSLGEQFVREWMEIFDRQRPRLEAMRKRITECGLTDESPEVHRMIVTCITEAMREFDLSTVAEPEAAIVAMLDCFDRELTALGCEPAAKPLNPWLVGGLAAGGVVLIGGGVYLATRD